ncbi:chaperone protein TorD [Salmonella enterica subsp. diarizonae]|uniref:Chaperone protein TorD n=1 Tax=Salmonella diarizonae TaxID=59204 RepID=A0A379TRT7_SALDZ|nr:chaperone protein TorD [Salmonella enterica subsp. diarizonae]
MIKHLLLEAGMEVNDGFKEPAESPGNLSGITQPFTFFIG